MVAVAESTFLLRDRATPVMRDMRAEAVKTRMALRDTGKALDRIGTAEQNQRIDRLSGRMDRLGNRAEVAGRQVERNANRMADSIALGTRRAMGELGKLEDTLRMLGATTARPEVEVSGTAQAMAEVRALRGEIAKLKRQSATVRIGTSRVGGTPGGGGGGFGGRFRGGMPGGMLGLGVLATALPLVQGLAGATVALGSSLGAAGLAAGAGGIAGGGSLAVGLGASLAVIKPMAAATKEATKAQEKYNDAVEQYGAASEQARQAKDDMDAAFRKAPPGTRRMIAEAKEVGAAWRAATRDAQGIYTATATSSMSTFRQRALPTYARASTTVASANAVGAAGLTDTFTGAEAQRSLAQYAAMYRDNMDEAAHIVENVFFTTERIGRAARPFLSDSMEWLDDWTFGWRRSTKDIEGTRRTMAGYVDDLKAWSRLTGSAFRLVREVGGASRGSGRSLVEDLTETFDKWSDFLDDNPGAARAWFQRTADSARSTADAVADIVQGADELATELQPVLRVVTQIASAASDIAGFLGPGGLGAAFLAYRSLRGASGAAGASMLLGGGGRGGGAGGAGGGSPVVVGGGGAGGARGGRGGLSLGQRLQLRGAALPINSAETRWAANAALASRGMASNGAMVGRVAGAAGRFAVPGLVLGAATGAFGHEGANTGQGVIGRGVVGLSNAVQGAGAMFGLANPVMGTDERTTKGQQRAQTFVSRLPGGAAPNARQAAEAAKTLRRELEKARDAYQEAVGSGNTNRIAEAKAYNSALADQAAQYRDIARETRRARNAELRDRSEQKGQRLTTSFGKAFDIDERRMGTEGAFRKTTDDVVKTMRRMRPEGAKVLGENILAWANEVKKKSPEVSDEVARLNRRIERSFSRTGQRVQIVNGQILTGSRSEWRRIRESIADPAEQARQRATKAFTDIQEQAVGSLRSMGYSNAEARGLVKAMERGGSSGRAARGAVAAGDTSSYSAKAAAGTVAGPSSYERRARGGRVPGHGTADTVPIGGALVAPGEILVANRHTENRIDRMLSAFGTSLDREVSGETTPHGAPAAFARGGRARVGGSPGGLRGGISSAVSSVLERFPGLSVTSTTGGTHAAGSYHYRGLAADLGGPANVMRAAAGWIASTMGSRLAEGIHNPNLSVKGGRRVPPSFWGPGTWAGHANHIHLAIDGAPIAGGLGRGASSGGAAALGALASVSLRAPKIRGGGVAGVMAERAAGMYAAGLEQRINDRLAESGGPMGAPTGAGGAAPKGQVRSWLAQALRITGHYSAANLNALYSRAMQESGGNPAAVNNWDSNAKAGYPSRGLLQTIPQTFNRYRDPNVPGGITDPIANAVAAINYMFDRYGHIVGANGKGYARGGRIPAADAAVPWFGKGGRMTAKRPTVIGVGDTPGRSEDVTIKPRPLGPASARGGGGRGTLQVTFAPSSIVVQGGSGTTSEAAIEAAVRRAIQRAADELDFGVEDDDDALMGAAR